MQTVIIEKKSLKLEEESTWSLDLSSGVILIQVWRIWRADINPKLSSFTFWRC